MFIDVSIATARSEERRQTLMAEARDYRLAKLAGAGRRAAQRATDEALQRIADRAAPEPHDRVVTGAGKADANCR